jgi:hypothetical protein
LRTARSTQVIEIVGAPEEIRTPDPQIQKSDAPSVGKRGW